MSRAGRDAWALVAAAGAGRRMGGATPKQFIEIGGRPILALTLERLLSSGLFKGAAITVPEAEVERTRRGVVEPLGASVPVEVVPGGAERTDSVRRGLEGLAGMGAGEDEIVAVHDGVRPFVTHETLRAALEAARRTGAAIAAVPVKDTVKVVREGLVEATPERSGLWLVQTPQTFRFGLLREAYARALAEGAPPATDDAALVERLGRPVRVVEGGYDNIKITTREDLLFAEALLRKGRP